MTVYGTLGISSRYSNCYIGPALQLLCYYRLTPRLLSFFGGYAKKVESLALIKLEAWGQDSCYYM